RMKVRKSHSKGSTSTEIRCMSCYKKSKKIIRYHQENLWQVNTPIKIQSGLLVILLASIVGCKQQANRVVDDYAERDSSFGKWNSGIQDYQNTWPDEFKIGSVPTKNEIARWDIDVR